MIKLHYYDYNLLKDENKALKKIEMGNDQHTLGLDIFAMWAE